MDAAMTGDRLAQIKSRLAVATPGPWYHGDKWHVQGAKSCKCRSGVLIHEGPMGINGATVRAHVHETKEPWWEHGVYAAPSQRTGWHPVSVVIDTDEYGYMDDGDADLIANAPSDLAWLIAEVEALRERMTVPGIGQVIWETSRNDEGTISATGADIVARAVIDYVKGESDE